MATALDANILLRFTQESHPEHDLTLRAVTQLEEENETLCLLPQNLVEYRCVATRPTTARGGFGLTPTEADLQIQLLESMFILVSDTSAIHPEWRQIVMQYGVSGLQVYDARIAACLRVHGITRLLTFNTKDFARYSGFDAVDPAQV